MEVGLPGRSLRERELHSRSYSIPPDVNHLSKDSIYPKRSNQGVIFMEMGTSYFPDTKV